MKPDKGQNLLDIGIFQIIENKFFFLSLQKKCHNIQSYSDSPISVPIKQALLENFKPPQFLHISRTYKWLSYLCTLNWDWRKYFNIKKKTAYT